MTTYRHRRRRTVHYCPLEPPWSYPDVLAAAVCVLVTGHTEPGQRVLLAEPLGGHHDEIVEAILRLGRGATTVSNTSGGGSANGTTGALIIGPRSAAAQIARWTRRLTPAGTLIIITTTCGARQQCSDSHRAFSDSVLRRRAALAGLMLVERLILVHQPPSARPPRSRDQRLAVAWGGHRPAHSEAHVFQPINTDSPRRRPGNGGQRGV